MWRLLLVVSASTWASPALAVPISCRPEGPAAIVAAAGSSAEAAQLGERTAIAWIGRGGAHVAVLGRLGFEVAAARSLLPAGDTTNEIAVAAFGGQFVVLWIRQTVGRPGACELVGLGLTRDGTPLGNPVTLGTSVCGADGPRFRVAAGHDSLAVAHLAEASGGGVLEVLEWAPGEPSQPAVRAAEGTTVRLEDFVPREGGFALAFITRERGPAARLLDDGGNPVGSERRNWTPGAFWIGTQPFYASSVERGIRLERTREMPTGGDGQGRAVRLALAAERFTPVRAGGRAWLRLATAVGHRLLPLDPAGTAAGLPTPSIAPRRASFESVRVAIDGQDGAVAWLVDGRVMWRRLVCRD